MNRRTVKGIQYLMFDAIPGAYVAGYPVPPGGSGGSGGATPARGAPTVRVRLLSKRVSKRGTIAMRVSCPAVRLRCKVALVLKRGRATAARKTTTVKGGRSLRITLRLTKAARRALARQRRLRLAGVISAAYGVGSRSRQTLRITVRRG